MKILYIECSMGAAGDMLASALLELVEKPEELIEKLNSISLPKVTFSAQPSTKCGIKGTHLTVLVDDKQEHEHEHHHSHRSMREVENIINGLKASNKVKSDVLGVYKIIAQAESKVHGVEVSDIHFHEVGTLDAVADITAVCMLIEELRPDKIIASPVNTGSGFVSCAHGVLPVPAPAAALILEDIPTYSNGISSELCTPTGAALLKYFCEDFGQRPVMKTKKIGCGMGNKDFETANCLRSFLCEGTQGDAEITELEFNVDDMTGEETGFLTKTLFENGAREVFTIPVGMKKSRTGILVKVLCDEEIKEKMLSVIFGNSSTIGVRQSVKKRYTLERSIKVVETPYGEIRKKISTGYGVDREKYEYDDLERIAVNNSLTLSQVREIAEKYENI